MTMGQWAGTVILILAGLTENLNHQTGWVVYRIFEIII